MAITITPTKLGAVGNRLAYQVDVTVGGGTTGAQAATISNATLLTDTVAGPLRDFFTNSAPASTAAAQTLLLATHTWNVSALVGAALAGNFTFTATPDAAANVFTVTLGFNLGGAANGTYSFLLEIIFNEVGYNFPHGGPG